MKIAICDDDIQFIDTTCLLLEKWANEHGIPLTLYRLQSGDSLILTLQKECIDLIFLDVVMPMLNGIETARELRNNSPTIPIVFLSSSREFAVDSYELKAFNYLLKPISEDRLFAVLDDFLKMQTKNEDFIIAQTITGFCKINFADVIYLEAQNKHVNVYLTNGSIPKIRESFSKCEELFPKELGFHKCHRSYIVNLNHVREFTKTLIVTDTNDLIPISRNSYTAFKETYLGFMFH